MEYYLALRMQGWEPKSKVYKNLCPLLSDTNIAQEVRSVLDSSLKNINIDDTETNEIVLYDKWISSDPNITVSFNKHSAYVIDRYDSYYRVLIDDNKFIYLNHFTAKGIDIEIKIDKPGYKGVFVLR